MGRTIITSAICPIVFFEFLLSAGRQIAKDCRALSVRYQRLARGADCYAAAIAASGIAANVRVVYKPAVFS